MTYSQFEFFSTFFMKYSQFRKKPQGSHYDDAGRKRKQKNWEFHNF